MNDNYRLYKEEGCYDLNDMQKQFPSKEEAESLLQWANEQNPGTWIDHSRVVARAAVTIADKCALDTHRAYVSGLLHDIGRYEGIRGMHHIYAGYELLKGKGYECIGEICLSHSFPYKHIDEYFGKNDCTETETEFIMSFLAKKTYDDYDKLIQLCDTISTAEGVCLIEVRVMDVMRRYGIAKYTPNKLETLFGLKKYFDELCKDNVYDLFYDEIREISFR